MAVFFDSFLESIIEPRDEVVDKWPISDNPSLIFGILGTYLLFVKKWGPKWMEGREPYNPKRFVMVYNLLQVVLSLAMVIWPLTDSLMTKSFFSVSCPNHLFVGSDQYYEARRYVWAYLLLKLLDLLDTILMVIRKKQKQITFLHIYHHVSVTIIALIYLRWTFGEQVPIFLFNNSLVHVVMYFYYFLAGLGPEMQKRLWWKKYITVLQLAQFVINMVVSLVNLLGKCEGNKFTSISAGVYAAIYVYLFGKFYVDAYLGKNKKKVTD